MPILCPVLEVHYRVLYPWRQPGTTAFSSSLLTRVSRVGLSQIALFPSISSLARSETDASFGAICVAQARTTVTSDRLLEEVPHSRTRLKLIPVVSIRGEHPLLRREERACVHGMAIRSAQPADVRPPVGLGEFRRLMGLFLRELGDIGGYTSPSLRRNVYLRDTVVRTTHLY